MIGGDVSGCQSCGTHDPLSGKWVPTPDGEFGAWTCENCGKGDVDPYTKRIFELYLLQKGGYEFGQDDLDPMDRIILGVIEISLTRRAIHEAIETIFGNNAAES